MGKDTTIMIMTIMVEEEVKEVMEVEDVGVMVEEDLEMVEEEEAMVPKIAKTPNVNRLLMEKITATSSQMTFLTEEETGDTEDIDDFIFSFSSNRNKLFK